MKLFKLLFWGLILLVIVSCSGNDSGDKLFEVKYKIHYPSETKTYTKYVWGEDCCYLGSQRGSNHLSIDVHRTISSSSAPIEFISSRELSVTETNEYRIKNK